MHRVASRLPTWVWALVFYLGCEVVLFGPGTFAHIATGAVGSNPTSDYQVGTWSLEWWPWAVLHGHDPLHTGAVWVPWGYPTPWMTSIPSLALIAAPITLVAGPLVAYNVLMLAALPAASLAAYALCRELTHRFVPSLVGGYIYGFSPYLLGQSISQHLNLVEIWPVPLIVLLAIRYLRGTCRPRSLVALTALLGIVLVGSSLELLALAVPVAMVALVTAYVTSAAPRASILKLTAWFAAASAFVALFALPFAWLTLVKPRPPLPYAPESFATDLANLVVPTTTVVGGNLGASLDVSTKFVGNVGEQGGYLGLPLLAVCVVAILSDRRRGVWVAAAALVASLLWSLGPAVVIAGRTISSEPLSLDHLPVLHLSLPSRMSFVVALAAAVLAAVWLSRASFRWPRFAAAALIVGSLWPHTGALSLPADIVAMHVHQNYALFGWRTPVVPAAPAALSHRRHADQSLLVLPFAWRKPTAYWQAIDGMRFRTVGGYTPFLPLQAVGDPTIYGLLAGFPGALAVERLRVFLHRAHVDQVVMLPGTGLPWRRAVHSALRPPSPASPPLPHSISSKGADAQAPVGTARSGRAAAAWSQWDPTCQCGRIAFSFPAGRASTTLVSERGFEASGPAVAVSRDGRHAAAAWIEARDGHVRVGLVRAGLVPSGTRVQHLRVADIGLPGQLSVGIDDTGRVTLAETVQRDARHLLVVERLDPRGVASAPQSLSGSGADALSPLVVTTPRETFIVWRQVFATATSIHVMTAEPQRRWIERAVIRMTGATGGVVAPTLEAGPDGITLAWLVVGAGGTAVRALPLDRQGRPLGRPVAVASTVQKGAAIAVAGDGRTVVVTRSRSSTSKRARVAQAMRIEPESKRLLKLVIPPGWRQAGPAVTVLGAPLLAVPLAGPHGRATLLEPLDKSWRRRLVSSGIDGNVLAVGGGEYVLHTDGNRQTQQVLLDPLRRIPAG